MAKGDIDPLALILLGVGGFLLFSQKKATTLVAPSTTTGIRPSTTNRAATTTQAYVSSDYIKWVQQSLNAINGAGLSVDGVAGPATKTAVKVFQQQWGITADGIVGPETDYYLNSAQAMPGYTDQPYAPVPSGQVWY